MKKKILVVEDNMDCRDILVTFLRHAGFEATAAGNGAQAINQAVNEVPDLIVMDLGLPDISGIEVATLLKQDLKTSRIPIVVHSGWPAETWKDRALQAGAGAYLTKPTSSTILQRTIEQLTERAKSDRSPDDPKIAEQSETGKQDLPESPQLPPGLRRLEDDLYVLDLREKRHAVLSEREPSSKLVGDRMKRLYEHLWEGNPELGNEIPEFDLPQDAKIDKLTWDYEWTREIAGVKKQLKKRLKPRG